MEMSLDPNEKIMCPYNKAHHILRYRMNTHLVKCKKSYPEAKLVECDFNVDHKIPEPELQYHHENCPDRAKIEVAIYQEAGTDINKYPIHNIEVPDEESWDDCNVATYDPAKVCEGKDILRRKDVQSAAVKRDFRIAERTRLGQLNNDKPDNYCGPQVHRNPTVTKRDLPLPPRPNIEEDTPEPILSIINRIKMGAKQSFLPKTD